MHNGRMRDATSATQGLEQPLSEPLGTELEAFSERLCSGGLRASLEYLNHRTPHRFTGVFRFDGDMLRSVELVDKWQADVRRGDDIPIANAYCSHLHGTGEDLEVTDGATDPRTPWMASSGMRSYSGALIRDVDGAPWGTICHYDAAPCQEARSSLPLLVAAASLLHAAAVMDEKPAQGSVASDVPEACRASSTRPSAVDSR